MYENVLPYPLKDNLISFKNLETNTKYEPLLTPRKQIGIFLYRY